MTHVVHPYAHRIGVIRGWRSRWFSANRKEYREFLRVDTLVREWLVKRLKGSYVAGIEIERNRKTTKIIIKTSRPGMIIGRQGEGVTKLKRDIVKFMKKKEMNVPSDLKIDIQSVDNPDANAAIVAAMVVEALEKRMPFRRVMKQTAEKVMAVKGVKGVRIVLAGRLGGAEMSRKEETKLGAIPLQFMRADIDYKRDTARLSYGVIGVKVWINKGDVLHQNTPKD